MRGTTGYTGGGAGNSEISGLVFLLLKKVVLEEDGGNNVLQLVDLVAVDQVVVMLMKCPRNDMVKELSDLGHGGGGTGQIGGTGLALSVVMVVMDLTHLLLFKLVEAVVIRLV